ncbi:MAG TPA: SlyX family protein [Solimonas sp.]|nr:SlyX family protein [Solimonas sp.]
MDEARLVELETRLAHQEATLRDLDDVVARQQQQIDRLVLLCRTLMERALAPQDPGKHAAEDEVPPHW